jgi:hypothetical protein
MFFIWSGLLALLPQFLTKRLGLNNGSERFSRRYVLDRHATALLRCLQERRSLFSLLNFILLILIGQENIKGRWLADWGQRKEGLMRGWGPLAERGRIPRGGSHPSFFFSFR